MIDLSSHLANYQPFDEKEARDKDRSIHLLNKFGQAAFDRDNMAGHFTASSIILNQDRDKILLILHRKLNKWLQPGGHCDGNTDTFDVARTEVMEEIGLSADDFVTAKTIFRVDIHEFNFNDVPIHDHYDIRYVSIIDQDVELTKNDREVIDLRWFDFDELQDLGDHYKRMSHKLRLWATD